MSLQADLLFRCLLVVVDDWGRWDARIDLIRSACFPARPDVTPKQVTRWLQELCDEGCVGRYQVGDDEYLFLPGWEKHRGNQKRAKESRFPDPAETRSEAIPGDPGDSRRSPDIRSLGSGSLGGSLGLGEGSSKTQSPPSGRRRGRSNPPEALAEPELTALRSWCEDVIPRLAPRLEAEIESALDYHRREGHRFVDWVAAVRDTIRSRENARRRQNGDPPVRSRDESKRLRAEVERMRAEIGAPP